MEIDKSISPELDHGNAVLESPTVSQSVSKMEKSSSKQQGEMKPDRSPSASSSSSTTSRTSTKKFPLKHKTRSINVKSLQSPNTKQQFHGIKDLEIRLLQVECEELKNRLACLREGLMGQKPSDMEELLKQSQKELLWLQRQLSFISPGGSTCTLSASKVSSFIIVAFFFSRLILLCKEESKWEQLILPAHHCSSLTSVVLLLI
nr:uncharacterized protein LOC112544823 [Pelodiscus sinensis]|eukprot:XP_025037544.1 uncharacterized protein LOC112544823 [Pelodiscus sinensis]